MFKVGRIIPLFLAVFVASIYLSLFAPTVAHAADSYQYCSKSNCGPSDSSPNKADIYIKNTTNGNVFRVEVGGFLFTRTDKTTVHIAVDKADHSKGENYTGSASGQDNITIGNKTLFDDYLTSAGLTDENGNDPCAVQASGLSWVICPFIRTAQDIAQGMYNNVVKPLLFVQPFDQSNNNAVKGVWSAFRTLANALFVLAFLYIIFANVFSYNMNVYTVRKMLPRLVVAVVLVQFSYMLASLIVDIGNIIGVGIRDFVSAAISGQGKQDSANNPITTVYESLNIVFSTVLVSLLTGAAVVTFGIGVSVMAAFGVIIGLAAAAITLIIRQLLIATLVVLSPIAFVAWVLPNTEKWFKFWWENLTKLVMMFPIISLIMSLGSLFAVVAGTQDGKLATINQLAASLFPIVALLLIPTAFSIAGRLFGGVTNFVGNRTGGAQRSLRGSQLRRNMQEDQKLKLSNYESQRGKGGLTGFKEGGLKGGIMGNVRSARGYVAGASQGRVFGRKGAGNEFRYQRTQSATADEMSKRLAADASITTTDLITFVKKGEADNRTLKSMKGNAAGLAAAHAMVAQKGLYDQDVVKRLNEDQTLTNEQRDSVFSYAKKVGGAQIMEENMILGYANSRNVVGVDGKINSLAMDEKTREFVGSQITKVTGQKLAKMSKEGIEALQTFQVGTDAEIAAGTGRSGASFLTASAIEGTTGPTVAAGMSDVQRGALYDVRNSLNSSAKVALRMNYDDASTTDPSGRTLVRVRQDSHRNDIKKAMSDPDSFYNAYRLTVDNEVQTDTPLSMPQEKPKSKSSKSSESTEDGGTPEPGVTEEPEDNA